MIYFIYQLPALTLGCHEKGSFTWMMLSFINSRITGSLIMRMDRKVCQSVSVECIPGIFKFKVNISPHFTTLLNWHEILEVKISILGYLSVIFGSVVTVERFSFSCKIMKLSLKNIALHVSCGFFFLLGCLSSFCSCGYNLFNTALVLQYSIPFQTFLCPSLSSL